MSFVLGEGARHPHHGLHQGGGDHAVHVRPAQEVPQGRGPLRAQDGRHLRRQALRHQSSGGPDSIGLYCYIVLLVAM